MTESSRRQVSSIDVAAHAGVSQATVSRVLSGKDQVSEATRERVERSLEELGYQPNLNARALKTQRTQTIAVVVADITNPFYPELVEALNEALSAKGQLMLLWDYASNGDDASVLAAMQQGIVDGAIFATATNGSATLAKADELNLPVVLVNRNVADRAFDSVTSDNEVGGRLVAEYFALHRRRPAVVAGPIEASTSRDRAAGFVQHWAIDHPNDTVRVHHGDFSYESGTTFVTQALAGTTRPDAIFATNDLTAFGVLDEAHKLGVRVPEDLWVVGYDDIAMAQWATFDLTTVRQPTAAMARDAVRLLLDRLDDRDRPQESIRFGGELVIRGTTARAVGRLPHVVKGDA